MLIIRKKLLYILLIKFLVSLFSFSLLVPSKRAKIVEIPFLHPHSFFNLVHSAAVRRRGGVHKPRRRRRGCSVLEASVLCGVGILLLVGLCARARTWPQTVCKGARRQRPVDSGPRFLPAVLLIFGGPRVAIVCRIFLPCRGGKAERVEGGGRCRHFVSLLWRLAWPLKCSFHSLI